MCNMVTKKNQIECRKEQEHEHEHEQKRGCFPLISFQNYQYTLIMTSKRCLK